MLDSCAGVSFTVPKAFGAKASVSGGSYGFVAPKLGQGVAAKIGVILALRRYRSGS